MAQERSPLIQATLLHRLRAPSKIPSWHTRYHISNKQNRLDISIQVRGISGVSSTGPGRGWLLPFVGSMVELRRANCKFVMYGERKPHPLQSHRRFMAGWCGGKTVYQVYLAGEVLSFVEDPYLVLLHGRFLVCMLPGCVTHMYLSVTVYDTCI